MSCLDVLDRYTPEERTAIAGMKRLFEWAHGDAEFGRRLFAGRTTRRDRERLGKIGIAFDPGELSLFWEKQEIAGAVVAHYSSLWRRGPLDRAKAEALDAYPLLKLWLEFSEAWGRSHLERRTSLRGEPRHPCFAGWWDRRIEAVRNELGVYGRYLGHCTMAFELSEGCSRRCPFCAYAPGPLRASLPFSEGGTFFKECLGVCIELFGKEAAGESLLYYATEPHDNADYLAYLRDFTETTGAYPCTSTAVVRDEAWIRSLAEFYRKGGVPYPRLSVLSLADLRFLHETFSCEELLPLQLSMMMSGSKEEKVKSGLLFAESPGMKAFAPKSDFPPKVPQGSISCVSGFLVNLCAGTVRLVSPCYSSGKWPLGYRIFDEAKFERRPESFRDALSGLIERNMPETLPGDFTLRFRDDFEFRETPSGFDLVSCNQIMHFRGGERERTIGRAIDEGSHTCEELSAMAETAFGDMFFTPVFLRELYEEGVLNEIRG